MKSSFLTPYLSGKTIHAICWTLIHSLWIGLAVALLSGLVITITRKSSAVLRYNLLCGILVLFTLSMGVTFYVEMKTPAIEQISTPARQVIYAPDNHIVIVPATNSQITLIERTAMFLNGYSNIIFIVWLLFFALKSLKMAGGLLYIQRIRNYRIHDVSDEFKHKIEMFARQIGIRRVVRLVQSELVKVPVAVGWLRPMILLPMGILLQLPPEQLESILWHELAHIRRRDYLVNILQGLLETIFFFNPGVLWLSSLIRTEREACCDDMVLSRMDRKANYLEALLAFGYEDNGNMALAMGIGSGNQLRDRMKRMISQENKRLNGVEKVVLIAGIVVLSAFTGLPKTTRHAVRQLVNVMINKPRHADTLKSKIATADSATKQTREFEQIDVISGDTLHRKTDTAITFVSVLFKNSDGDLANNDISAKDEKGKKYHFIVTDNKLVAMDINGRKVKDIDLPNYQYIVTQIDVAVLEKRHIRELDMARFKANNPAAKFKADRGFDKQRFVDPRPYKDSTYIADLQKMHEIIADLVVRKVVPGSDAVKWFALTDAEFIVNGQKQPIELQRSYQAKYGVHEGYGLYYGPAPVKGKGVFINPAGEAKAGHFLDSIRSRRFNARLGSDDEKRVLKLQMMRERFRNDSISYTAQKDRALNVIADLVNDKAVSNPASVKWFGLSNTEFLVNGQKQPEEMQQRYKTKYGIYEGNGLYYGPVQMHGVGVFIDADHSGPPLPPGAPRLPKAPREPGSRYVRPKYVDTNAWKIRQMIKQQQAFAVDQDKKRAKLVEEQQRFVEQENKKREQLVRDQQAFAADQARKREQLMNRQQADQARQRELDAKQRERFIADGELKRQQRARDFGELYKGPRVPLQDILANITSDLVSANVLTDKGALVKFNLTNSALMVNGVKQSEELHQKLKAKYLEKPDYKINADFAAKPNFGLHFNAQSGAMGLGITDGPDSP